jgi:hypothetical protein
MNERDKSLMLALMASLDSRSGGAVLIDADSTQFVRMNLVLLKGLLEEKGLRGIFVTVDRPHQYMAHLLRMHQVSIEGLVFIDAIGRFSADRKETLARAGYVDEPFHIDTLPDAIASMQSGDIPGLDVNKIDFVMIDNLAALLPFNSYASVEAFVNNFISLMTTRWNALIPLVVDQERYGLLYETVLTHARDTIPLRGPNMERPVAIETRGRRTISGKRYDGGA